MVSVEGREKHPRGSESDPDAPDPNSLKGVVEALSILSGFLEQMSSENISALEDNPDRKMELLGVLNELK